MSVVESTSDIVHRECYGLAGNCFVSFVKWISPQDDL